MRRKAKFEELLSRGTRRSIEGYIFYLGRRDSGGPRLGILVSRRHSPKAVQRNRIKRCVREAFRLAQDGLGAVDLLVRPPYGVKPSRDMITRLRKLIAGVDR